MGHDVFISYSSKDKPTADAACAVLESKGLRCWIAPRDILPGEDWGQSIIAAINGCKVMVLIFSSHANQSQQIKREVERAVHRGLPLIPVRIEDVLPASSLEYFLSTPHWLDAFTPPLERHLLHLAATIMQLLSRPQDPPSPQPPPPPPGPCGDAAPCGLRRRRPLSVPFCCVQSSSGAPATRTENSIRRRGMARNRMKVAIEAREKTEKFGYTMAGLTKIGTRRVLTLDLGGGVRMEFVHVPHGTFMMGSPDSDKDAYDSEKPRHTVEITKDFYLGKYLITKEQFERFAAEVEYEVGYKTENLTEFEKVELGDERFFDRGNLSWHDPGFDQSYDHPVVDVSCDEAKKFCDWAGRTTKFRVRLPTEAEWEYACRAGTQTRFWCGDSDAELKGNANIADAALKEKYPVLKSTMVDPIV